MVFASIQWRPELRYRFVFYARQAQRQSAPNLTLCSIDDEKSCMLLVMRTLSIVPLNFKVRG